MAERTTLREACMPEATIPSSGAIGGLALRYLGKSNEERAAEVARHIIAKHVLDTSAASTAANYTRSESGAPRSHSSLIINAMLKSDSGKALVGMILAFIAKPVMIDFVGSPNMVSMTSGKLLANPKHAYVTPDDPPVVRAVTAVVVDLDAWISLKLIELDNEIKTEALQYITLMHRRAKAALLAASGETDHVLSLSASLLNNISEVYAAMAQIVDMLHRHIDGEGDLDPAEVDDLIMAANLGQITGIGFGNRVQRDFDRLNSQLNDAAEKIGSWVTPRVASHDVMPPETGGHHIS